MVVIRLEGAPYLCKTDEVGELCVCSGYTGAAYWGLQGLSTATFQVLGHTWGLRVMTHVYYSQVLNEAMEVDLPQLLQTLCQPYQQKQTAE